MGPGSAVGAIKCKKPIFKLYTQNGTSVEVLVWDSKLTRRGTIFIKLPKSYNHSFDLRSLVPEAHYFMYGNIRTSTNVSFWLYIQSKYRIFPKADNYFYELRITKITSISDIIAITQVGQDMRILNTENVPLLKLYLLWTCVPQVYWILIEIMLSFVCHHSKLF